MSKKTTLIGVWEVLWKAGAEHFRFNQARYEISSLKVMNLEMFYQVNEERLSDSEVTHFMKQVAVISIKIISRIQNKSTG